ncbi:hypothetical protein OSTOST_12254 [Ostertagia ostertagi]
MGFSIQRWMLDYVTPPCDLTNVYYAEFLRGLIYFQTNSAFETTQQLKRRIVERTFVQQVTLQGALYVAELVTYFYVANYFPVSNDHVVGDPNRWPNFLLTTYAWILVHTLDG